MPDEEQYAAQIFAAGLGRRAAFGCCADCGKTLRDVTLLICSRCRRDPKNAEDPRLPQREAGHRDRITDLFRGVRDGSLTFEKVNAMYRKKRKAMEVKAA